MCGDNITTEMPKRSTICNLTLKHQHKKNGKEKTLTNILKDSAKVNIGYKKPKSKSENDDIIMLSSMQRVVQKQIESNKDDREKASKEIPKPDTHRNPPRKKTRRK